MLIENPDAFKTWLTSVLEPLCDADPEALAKYVYALVKKDKTIDVLRQGMLDQLDVFLQTETKPFVELLFRTLETQEYLMPPIPNANPPNPNVPLIVKKELATGSPLVAKSAPIDLLVKDIKPIIPVSTLPNLSESMNGNVLVKKEDVVTVASASAPTPTPTLTPAPVPVPLLPAPVIINATQPAKRDHRRSDSEKEDRTRSGRGRHRSASRNRSRSRSWERSKRSRSPRVDRSPRGSERSPRDRNDRRGDRIRPWRNKSPPRGTRYDRRRSRTNSPPSGRLRSRSRSPRHSYNRSNRYRNRSPPRSLTRSRSRSNERNRMDKDKKDVKSSADVKESKDENSGGATPTQDSNHGDTDMRLTNTTQSIQSVVSALNPSGGGDGRGSGTGPSPGVPAAFASGKRRCRDFDEKGYCMRGEMCPYDHGVDPVVLEDTALSRVLTFGPAGPNGAPGVAVDSQGGPPVPPVLMHHPPLMSVAPPQLHNIYVRPGVHSEYNPQAPGMWHRPGFRGGPRPIMGPRGGIVPMGGGPFTPLPSMQRELINVPVMDSSDKFHGFKRRAQEYHHEGAPADGHPTAPTAAKRKPGFDFNRLGPRAKNNPINCSLELKKVPRGLNNITHLNNHFCKFGKIVNIQVCYDGDPEAAIVTFSSHAEANAAYRSTEAVLNNRFIKVFWHSNLNQMDNNKQENVPPPPPPGAPRPVKDRLGQPMNNSNKVFNLVQPKAAGTETTPEEEEAAATNVDAAGRAAAAAAAMTGADMKVNNNNNKSTNNVYVPSALTKQQQEATKALANAAIVKSQEILAAKEQLKKKHEEKRKEALKITHDLRKRKQELLEKQLAQQKLLIEKLEKTNPTGQQRELLMTTIKTVQESIESIRKDMLSTPPAAIKPVGAAAMGATPPALPKKSKEEAQKEVLDAELDLITKQQEGGDTSELQKRLLELRAQAYSLAARGGRGGMRGARRGRGGIIRATHLLSKNNLVLDNSSRSNSFVRGRGGVASTRGTFQKHTVVDHRPTRLLVSGYEADESDSVLAHFAQYGEIIDYVSDDSTPSIVLNYKTRKEAEVALLKGKHFQDRTLSVTWCNGTQLSNQRATSRTVVLSESNVEDQLLEGDDEMVASDPVGGSAVGGAAAAAEELSEEALLQDDEDDDDEERSWRR